MRRLRAAEGAPLNWQPGLPVRTAQDHAEWETWRRERKRQQQHERRALYPRIDYYPDDYAFRVIGSLVKAETGHDLSSVISRIVV